VEPRRRLNPLSPLLNSAKTVAAVIAFISIQGFVQLGWPAGLGVVLVAISAVAAISVVSWLVTGYHVVGRELRVYDGVLVRRARAIPLERLQSVEVVRPLLARAVGLAELRLEVVGGSKTEAPLAFLTIAEAVALRERLLALAARAGAPAGPSATQPAETATGPARPAEGWVPPAGATGTLAAAPGEVPPGPGGLEAPPAAAPSALGATAERPLHQVVNREIVISQILTPQVMFLPVGVAMVVVQSVFGTTWSLVVLLSTVVAVIGVVQQPVRRVLADWNFRLALQDPPPGHRYPGLRLRHGLTETRSQTVPLHRVQAVGVIWPLLWRRRRWLRCRLDVAGVTASEGIGPSDQLLPVGDLATARFLVGVVLPGVDLADLGLVPAPRRARWLAPFRQPVLAAALTDHAVATQDGRITRQVVIVPYQRIQSVRVVQGPRQRWLGLASVHVDTAGSLRAVAHHRDLAEARRLAADLTERARAARAASA